MLSALTTGNVRQALAVSRSEGITVQHLGEGAAQETLLYDEARHKAFCLNPLAAAVWSGCDGTHTVPQLAAAATASLGRPVSTEMVELAVAELRRDDLLLGPLPAPAALSRRRLMTQMGAGAALMLPAIAVVLAPKAAQAYGGCFDCSNASPAAMQRAQRIRAQQARQMQAKPTRTTP